MAGYFGEKVMKRLLWGTAVLVAVATPASAMMCMFGSGGGISVFTPPSVGTMQTNTMTIMPAVNPATTFSSSSGSTGVSGGTVDITPPVGTAEPSPTIINPSTSASIVPMGPYTPQQQRRMMEARNEYNTSVSNAANSTANAWDAATKTAQVVDTVGAVTQQTLAFIPGAGSAANGVLDVVRGGAEGAAQAYADGKPMIEVVGAGTIGAASNFIANKVTGGAGNKAEAMTEKGAQILSQVAEGATRSTIDKTVKGGVNVVAGTAATAVVEGVENVVSNTVQTKLENISGK
jgi:hypothetical protein